MLLAMRNKFPVGIPLEMNPKGRCNASKKSPMDCNRNVVSSCVECARSGSIVFRKNEISQEPFAALHPHLESEKRTIEAGPRKLVHLYGERNSLGNVLHGDVPDRHMDHRPAIADDAACCRRWKIGIHCRDQETHRFHVAHSEAARSWKRDAGRDAESRQKGIRLSGSAIVFSISRVRLPKKARAVAPVVAVESSRF
jgi:hypothetical protein